MNRPAPSRASMKRPVLYQLCRAGERFEVGDGPVPLGTQPLVLGRGDPQKTDVGSHDGRFLVDDPWMSGRHAQVAPLERRGTDSSVRMRAQNGDALPSRYFIEDLGSTNGVLVNGAAGTRVPLLHGDLVETGRTFWVYVEEPATDPVLEAPFELGPIVTWTPSFAQQLKELHAGARTDRHALITGPEGSGKGYLARTLHSISQRGGRFVHLDCRERKSKRLVVDLFGSDTQRGRLKDADGGTLFLENLDALPLELQDRLATSLADGARKKTAARVVGSMSSTVDDAIAKNHARQQLMDALGGLSVRMPPLHQRLPDLGLLLDDFLARARGAPAIHRDAARVLMRFSFRLHVKALARVVEAAASLAVTTEGGARAGSIELVHLPVQVVGPEMMRTLMPSTEGAAQDATGEVITSDVTGPEVAPLFSATAQDQGETDPEQRRHARGADKRPAPLERKPTRAQSEAAPSGEGASVDPDVVAAAMRAARGNVSAAARQLGKPRALVQRWLREFGIDPTEYR